jgi:hypothetical protein
MQHGGRAHHHYRQRGEAEVLVIITFLVAGRNMSAEPNNLLMQNVGRVAQIADERRLRTAIIVFGTAISCIKSSDTNIKSR